MSAYYYNAHQQHPTPATASAVGHSHHGGRNRRAPRLSVSQNGHKQQQHHHHHQQQQQQQQQHQQFRQIRSIREMTDSLNLTAFRVKFEAGRSFDLEDDLEFCPGLLSENDLVSIHSASERSSLASNSPEHSPSQLAQAAPVFSLNASSPSFTLSSLQQTQQSMKLHQPAATRTRNPIPIVHPSSRPGSNMSMTTPVPPSVSPGLRVSQQALGAAW
ncbi:hypothetical protein SPI_06827 [Niveomyces insectorum RCEF 264]|uniref:Uncharacterized protein n=1 Tax=Niveomyces insectorum RCEF 264 TaxID=1081102 RepID=A0A167QT63_9HYPO|nr:hypothetical protein SPI_06827 [Niveomyces insectorum RCEF 264]